MKLEIHAKVRIQQIAAAMITHQDYAQISATGCTERTEILHHSTAQLATNRVVALINSAKDIFDSSAAHDYLAERIADLKAERGALARIRATRKLQFA